MGRDRAVAGIADPGGVVPPGPASPMPATARCQLQPRPGSRCSRDRWSRRGCPSRPASPMPATAGCRLQPRCRLQLRAGIAL